MMRAKNYILDDGSWKSFTQQALDNWNNAMINKTLNNTDEKELEAEEEKKVNQQNDAASYVIVALALIAVLVVIVLLRKKK